MQHSGRAREGDRVEKGAQSFSDLASSRAALATLIEHELLSAESSVLKDWRFKIDSDSAQVAVTAVLSKRIPKSEVIELEGNLSRALSPLDVRLRLLHSPDYDSVENFKRSAQPGSRYDQDRLYRDALRTLPVGIELLRTHRYQIPLQRGTFDFALFKLYIPEEREKDLKLWQEEFEQRNHIKIFVQRSRIYHGVRDQLENIAGADFIIDKTDAPKISAAIAGFNGNGHQGGLIAKSAKLPQHLPDLRKLPFITIDPASTRDMEDAVHAQRLKGGDIKLSVAFTDVTWFLQPRSPLELQAQKIGATIYGTHKSVPTLGSELAFSLASFNLGEPRVAWIAELIVKPNGKAALGHPPYRAIIESKQRYSPEIVDKLLSKRGPGDPNLDVLVEAASRLNAERMDRHRIIRLKGEGVGYQVVAEAMIAGKEALAKFMAATPECPAIFRVHVPPSAKVKSTYAKHLSSIGLATSAKSFDDPIEFAAILQSVQDKALDSGNGADQQKRATILLDRIINAFLTKSRFDPQNLGHHGLGVDAYMEIKARDSSGITNQFQLRAAVEGGQDKFSAEEVADRAKDRNRRANAYDWLVHRLRFFEMLETRLALVGQEFDVQVKRSRGNEVLIEAQDFTKWGVLRSCPRQPVVGQQLRVRLEGFDVKSMRFAFSQVSR